jgi:hypothetical protein
MHCNVQGYSAPLWVSTYEKGIASGTHLIFELCSTLSNRGYLVGPGEPL